MNLETALRVLRGKNDLYTTRRGNNYFLQPDRSITEEVACLVAFVDSVKALVENGPHPADTAPWHHEKDCPANTMNGDGSRRLGEMRNPNRFSINGEDPCGMNKTRVKDPMEF